MLIKFSENDDECIDTPHDDYLRSPQIVSPKSDSCDNVPQGYYSYNVVKVKPSQTRE